MQRPDRRTARIPRDLISRISRIDGRRSLSATPSTQEDTPRVNQHAAKDRYFAFPLNKDASEFQTLIANVVSGCMSERQAAKESTHSRSCIQKYCRLYRHVSWLIYRCTFAEPRWANFLSSCQPFFRPHLAGKASLSACQSLTPPATSIWFPILWVGLLCLCPVPLPLASLPQDR